MHSDDESPLVLAMNREDRKDSIQDVLVWYAEMRQQEFKLNTKIETNFAEELILRVLRPLHPQRNQESRQLDAVR